MSKLNDDPDDLPEDVEIGEDIQEEESTDDPM
jgi:hypothetical protein